MKSIKLLLTENVDNLGIVGDVVTVKAGYARNYLVPHGFAAEPTAGNIARLAERRSEVEAEMKAEHAALAALIEKLEGHEITIERSANEQGVLFGGVSPRDIADALTAEDLAVDERAVRLGHHIKRLDSYEIPIVLAEDLKTTIKLWVVSDKPLEELEADAAAEGDQPAAEVVEEAKSADAAAEPKPAED